MTLRILAEAEEEIESIRCSLNEQSPGLGARFIDDLQSAFVNILERPLRFSKLETLADSPYRRALLKHLRYAVVFEILPDEVLIVAVAHTSREPNYWIGRRE